MNLVRGVGLLFTTLGALTAGCSNSGSTHNESGQQTLGLSAPGADRTYWEYDAIGLGLVESVESFAIDEPSLLSTTGVAHYQGVLSMGLEVAARPTNFFGEMNLDVNFDDGKASGTISHVVDEENQAYLSDIHIENGSINYDSNIQTDFSFDAALSGSVSLGSSEAMNLSGHLFGDFYDDGAYLIGISNVSTNTVEGGTSFETGAFVLAQ